MRNRSGNEDKEGEVPDNANMWNILAGVCIYYPLSIGLTFFQKWFIKVATYKLLFPFLIFAYVMFKN